MNHVTPIALMVLSWAAAAQAQPSNIDPANKYCWGENAGFANWRDANGGAQGARIHLTFLSGYVWLENAGWLRLGNGTDPSQAGCFQYPVPASQTDATYGVSIIGGGGAPGVGNLQGYAWSETTGWVNFDAHGATLQGGALSQARYDRFAKRFRGYAWGENIGWINLDGLRLQPPESPIFVGTTLCPADADGDGVVQPADVALFVNVWFCSLQTGRSAGDLDGNGAVEPADVSLFVSTWFNALTNGC